jgi:methylated-DNA-[protein]-cysteine S-methyltransferase
VKKVSSTLSQITNESDILQTQSTNSIKLSAFEIMNTLFVGQSSPTPLGAIWVGLSERGLVALEIQAQRDAFMRLLQRKYPGVQIVEDVEHTAEAVRQVKEYLAGERREFDLAIDWTVMGPFQEQALRRTLAVPYGQVTTYGAIARGLGKPRAARAVGRAEATNPMPLVLPCHRVVGADGGLHGYGAPGGLETKAWLLRLEQGKLR